MISNLENKIHYIGRVSDCAENLNSSQGVVLLFSKFIGKIKTEE